MTGASIPRGAVVVCAATLHLALMPATIRNLTLASMRSARSAMLQVGDDGEDPAVTVFGVGQLQLWQEAVDVLERHPTVAHPDVERVGRQAGLIDERLKRDAAQLEVAATLTGSGLDLQAVSDPGHTEAALDGTNHCASRFGVRHGARRGHGA